MAKMQTPPKAQPRRPKGHTVPTPELPTQADIQERFDTAIREGVSPCHWIPPEWDKLEMIHGAKEFSDTSADAGLFAGKGVEEKIKARLKAGENCDQKPVKNPENLPDDNTWANPFGDTTHVDETQFSKEDHATLTKELRGASEALAKLNGIVGPSSPGMQRLARIFEWSLYRATRLMGDLNHALTAKDQSCYEEARENYLDFLRDLDDHEPEKGTKKSPRDIAGAIASDQVAAIANKRQDQIADVLVAKIAEKLTRRFGSDQAPKRAMFLARELAERLKNKPTDAIKETLAKSLDPGDKTMTMASGYGRAIKWACIDPVIFQGKIVGARVVAKWNPHLSSSGIPIPHG